MSNALTSTEIRKIRELCFNNPKKACASAQEIIDTCQVVSCSTFAGFKKKSKRTIHYKANNLTGINIEERRFLSINQ